MQWLFLHPFCYSNILHIIVSKYISSLCLLPIRSSYMCLCEYYISHTHIRVCVHLQILFSFSTRKKTGVKKVGTKGMSLLLRALTFLPEDCGLIPRTHIVAHDSLQIHFLWFLFFFWYLWSLMYVCDIQTYRQTKQNKLKMHLMTCEFYNFLNF